MGAPKPELLPLTGLRALAALAVVWGHYSFFLATFRRAELPAFLSPLFSTAYMGMTLFFVLSGFLMAYHYLDLDWAGTPLQSTFHFLRLRVARIYPVLLIFLAFMALQYSLKAQYGGRFGVLFTLQVFSLQTIYPFNVAGVKADGVSVAWSIGTEFVLYAAFAAIMIMWQRARRTRILLLLFGAAYFVGLFTLVASPAALDRVVSALPPVFDPLSPLEESHWLLYLSPYYRAFEFGCGVLAALYLTRWARPTLDWLIAVLVPVVLTVGIFMWARGQNPGPSGQLEYVLLAVGFAMLMAVANRDTKLNRFLSIAPLQFVGTVSLSVYLFQGVPAIALSGDQGLYAFSWPLFAHFLCKFALAMLLLMALASGSYRLIEVPARRLLRGPIRLWFRRPVEAPAE